MSQGVESCGQCGAKLAVDARACASCGAPVEGVPKGPVMMDGSKPPSDDPGRSTAAGLADPPPGQVGRTMMGLSGAQKHKTLTPSSPMPAAAPPGESDEPPTKPQAPHGKAMQRTMLGLPGLSGLPGVTPQAGAASAPAETAAQTAPASPEADKGARERAIKTAKATLFSPGGLGAIEGSPPLPPPSPKEPTPQSSKPSQGYGGATAIPARTMLGLPNLARPPSAPPDDPDADIGEQPTLLTPQPKEAAPSAAEPRAPSAKSADAGAATAFDKRATITEKVPLDSGSGRPGALVATDRPPPRKNLGSLMLGLVALGLSLGAGAYFFLATGSGPTVSVKVVSEGGAERMLFEVAGAASDSRVRFGGQEQPLAAGRAQFRLGGSSLQVGQNVVVFDVVEPTGKVHSRRVTLSLDYRVTVDPAPLQAGAGAVDIVVAALPGSRAWLDGEELKLDASGRGQKRAPIEAGATEGELEHVVSYRVQPPGQEPQVGQIRTPIRITPLRLDRPGNNFITDASWVEIAGAVPENAVVTIAGEPAATQEGRFVQRTVLPEPGKHVIKVTASAPGLAPRAIELTVERVTDLAVAAAEYTVDPTLNYARVAQNPAIYEGQRAAFEGRIYNVSVEGGVSQLQLLARDCPKGRRCAFWVSYDAATDLTVDRWVRVLGTLAGEHRFRAENDSLVAVPKLEAALLLPIDP